MQSINERIQILVENLGITKTLFADKLKVTQPYISKLINKGVPSDRLIEDICEKFSVNEEWLRIGKGEMFLSILEEDELAGYCAEICMGKSKLLESLILEYMHLDDSEQEVVEKLFKSVSKRMNSD